MSLKILGQTIRSKRENRGFTQLEVAERSDMDRNYIGMLERGERNPSYLSLQKIAKGLDMTVSQLINP
ncbi:MAG: helix-turn-helix transcriptional regulator [Bacteroidales bacterium]|nr:helix-turn-helix transcriptional regulator [Bacteroidales bacterium]